MKRNRLVLLIGMFLAAAAFALIVVSLNKNANTVTTPPPPTTVKVVVAAVDIPLGAKVTQDDVMTKDIPIDQKPASSFQDVALVIGQTARTQVTAQQLITPDIFNGGNGQIVNVDVPPGFVAIAIQVDQVTGVGTLIKAGDYVDVVTGLTGGTNVPVNQWQTNIPPASYVKVPDDQINSTTVKNLVQGLQVLGTLLPPPVATTGGTTPNASPGVSLNGQQEVVILAVTPQDAEIIKFAQVTSASISLLLRSAADCQDTSGNPAPCATSTTTGITLRILVDSFGVVPPQIIQVIQPQPLANPKPVVGAPNR